MAVDVDSHHERVVEPRLTDTLIDGIHFALFLRPSRTDSFSDAFEMARTAIAERERKANLPSSDPQMFVGKGIKRALEKFVSFRQAAMLNASARGSRR